MLAVSMWFAFFLGIVAGGILCAIVIAYIEDHLKTFIALGLVGFAIGVLLSLLVTRKASRPRTTKSDTINVFVYKSGKKVHGCDYCLGSAGHVPQCLQVPKAIIPFLQAKWCATKQCKHELQKHL